MNTCRDCGLPVRWVETEKSGKKNPLDPEPCPTGNFVLTPEGKARYIHDADRPAWLAGGGLIYESHFYSCPERRYAKQKSGGATNNG